MKNPDELPNDEPPMTVEGEAKEIELTREDYIEAMANRFEAEGVSQEQLRYMAAKLKRKVRTDATKPNPQQKKEKNRQKEKQAKLSRAKNRRK